MKIVVKAELDQKADVLVLGLFEEDNYHSLAEFKSLITELDTAIVNKSFEHKFGSQYSTVSLPYKKVLVLSLGKKTEFTLDKLRRVMGKAVKFTRSSQLESFTTNITSNTNLMILFNSEEIGRSAAEGLLLSEYYFTKYLSKEKKEKKKELVSVFLQQSENAPEISSFQKGLDVGRVIAKATNYARDLVNEPARIATPTYLEQEAHKIALSHNNKIKLKVLNQVELEHLGLGAFVGVSKGSDEPPKLLFLEYNGAGNDHWTAIVGKGITFDSGGYNLKMTNFIEDMKDDMSGGAAVLATIKAMAELGIKKNIVGVIPACENMIGGHAQHPGDIVTAYNGKTIEIRNTDAEGRLILSDALSYTEATYKPEVIIDLATLTGACVVALGYYASGLMSKDDKLISSLTLAGNKSGDRVWSLPFYEEYHDAMDGTISDLRNMSSKGKGYEAGAINGAVFLSKFVDKARWAHIDIAGPAFLLDDNDYYQKGASGAGVRLLMYWLLGQK